MIHDIISVFVSFGLAGIIIGSLFVWSICFFILKYKAKWAWMPSATIANLAVATINIAGSAIVNMDTAFILSNIK